MSASVTWQTVAVVVVVIAAVFAFIVARDAYAGWADRRRIAKMRRQAEASAPGNQRVLSVAVDYEERDERDRPDAPMVMRTWNGHVVAMEVYGGALHLRVVGSSGVVGDDWYAPGCWRYVTTFAVSNDGGDTWQDMTDDDGADDIGETFAESMEHVMDAVNGWIQQWPQGSKPSSTAESEDADALPQ